MLKKKMGAHWKILHLLLFNKNGLPIH
jgi:hypothetical protein